MIITIRLGAGKEMEFADVLQAVRWLVTATQEPELTAVPEAPKREERWKKWKPNELNRQEEEAA